MNLNLQVVSFDIGSSHVPTPGSQQGSQIASTKHIERVQKTVAALIKNFSASIFCLQQFNSDDCEASRVVLSILFENHFTVIASKNSRVAIAFAADYFMLVADTPFDTFSVETPLITDLEEAGMPSPGMCLDLVHLSSGVTLRIVSDRVLQFDAVKQKAAVKLPTRKISEDVLKQKTGHNGRLNWLLSQKETSLPALGDAALERSLDLVEPDDKVDFVIYGVNAHATAKYVSRKKERRLHPLRLRLFAIRDYVFDEKDKNPTTCDVGIKRKYDYILAKSSSKEALITVEDQILEGINGRKMCGSSSLKRGEHLPVLSVINFSKL